MYMIYTADQNSTRRFTELGGQKRGSGTHSRVDLNARWRDLGGSIRKSMGPVWYRRRRVQGAFLDPILPTARNLSIDPTM